jgi:hypothetical protein
MSAATVQRGGDLPQRLGPGGVTVDAGIVQPGHLAPSLGGGEPAFVR